MIWQPTSKQKEYLKLVISMSADCIMGKGTDTLKAYTKNLRMIADQIESHSQEGKKAETAPERK
jgi:hypothetical protein